MIDREHPPVVPADAHAEWSEAIDAMSPAAARSHAEAVREAASELGIWSRGGYVPLQPFVLGSGSANFLHGIGSRLGDLLRDHALEACGHDMGKLADIAELSEDERWFVGAERPLDQALGCLRPDVLVSDGRPYVLELNFGTCLNGTTAAPVLTDTLLSTPTGREMRRANDLSARSFFAARSDWARTHARGDGGRVALLGLASEGDEGSLRAFQAEGDYFAAHGVPCDFVPVEEAEVAQGSLWWRGRPYGTAIRYFMANARVRRDHMDFVIALEHAKGTRLLGSYVSQLFTSKALLADLYCDPRLDARQRRLLSFVPWTARLTPGWVDRHGDRVDPVEWAFANREEAVLKPFNLFGSRGVLMGSALGEQEWREAVEGALREGAHVVQERVRADPWPMRYWNLESEAVEAVEAPVLLGPYSVGAQDGGCFTQQPIRGGAEALIERGHPRSFGTVVSSSD
ncbi:hypothetical protein [Nocardiopsis synnemataformans]|uniref:hypothetical protein n=1 Tax=Nocardiopsis synnemataformans TaxID=61305 RepID=UPI003EBF6564